MQIAKAVVLIIFLGVIICTYMSLWYAINNLKDAVDDIKYKCDNTSEIETAKYMLQDCISKFHKELLTEIACLATKNNEDIKRLKGDFQQWDMFEFDGERWIIYRIDRNVNGDTIYRVHNAKGQITNINSKEMKNATFVKHAGSQFDD